MLGSFPMNKRHAEIRAIPYTFWPKGRVDASNVGIGAVILQKDKFRGMKAVVHASRGLITVEKKLQIEKESLSIIFGILRISQIYYSWLMIVITDWSSFSFFNFWI